MSRRSLIPEFRVFAPGGLRRFASCGLVTATVLLLPLCLPRAAPAAQITVDTLQDIDVTDGFCSLREAILAANSDTAHRECPAGSGADEIEIALPGTIHLNADLPQIVSGLTVRGLGPDATAIDGGGFLEVLHFTDAATGNDELLRVERLRITGGLASEGGAIYAGNNRRLEVVECRFDANEATQQGGAVRGDRTTSVLIVRTAMVDNHTDGSGGAFMVDQCASAECIDSTFAANTAGSQGGAIYASSVANLLVRQSTFSGNQANGGGGALSMSVTTGRLESSTLVGNLADADASGSGEGGGFDAAGNVTVTLLNTIVAGNSDATVGSFNCPDGDARLLATIATEGFNLIGANDCMTAANFPAGQPNVWGDLVGTAAAAIDPLLDVLEDNGGVTATHLPFAASPVVDSGRCPGAIADQRGFGELGTGLRIVDDPQIPDFVDGCDIGAVERDGVSLAGLLFSDNFETGDSDRWSAVGP